ncbi:hypothetical protein PROFUN_09511 [Planoprotostelium fungivorum]|uniref:Acyl-CoA dehydrogenase n=1 Tax=Planoprotostelium fungivorum TaxID=1890364 RepID=A0A2P6N8B0_9EUKA|nr:hypothetical protein PROFUN_12142 [Planoprotostelium fungivorum]PRP83299.1 hypothetical protein PROFUN_09511 [Planoprotostelium fungivorum]
MAAPTKAVILPPSSTEHFGSIIPFAEPTWYNTSSSTTPFYKESHIRLRNEIRKYYEESVIPHAAKWEEEGRVPDDVFKRGAQKGYVAAAVAHYGLSVEDLRAAGVSLPGNIDPSKWDIFHDFILTGVVWGMGGGNAIGCPPIINFASPQLRQEVLPGILNGSIRVCLGITEPEAAVKTDDGNHYRVNGSKKWITNALCTHGGGGLYVQTLADTYKDGMKGISMLLIPLKSKGIKMRPLKNSGVNSSGSTYIEFDDVIVDKKYLLGRENEGFRIIMSNFNHERLSLAQLSLRMSRICAEDAFSHAVTRSTFGKLLIENQVIREKLGKMGRRIESLQAWIELICHHYQLSCEVSKAKADREVAASVALAKVEAGRTLEEVCREAQQILGGLAYQRGSGRGARIEQISRDVRVMVVGGGSEEILTELGMRQQIVNFMAKSRM